jgi:hypothetical protein
MPARILSTVHTADWLLVDFFGPTRETRGWIRREDLVVRRWVRLGPHRERVEKCGQGSDDPDLCDVTTRRLVHGAYVVTKTKRRVK